MENVDYLVTVCDKCLCASCWHRDFMCQESQHAGTIEKRASELKLLDLEHPDHFSRETILRVTGTSPALI